MRFTGLVWNSVGLRGYGTRKMGRTLRFSKESWDGGEGRYVDFAVMCTKRIHL